MPFGLGDFAIKQAARALALSQEYLLPVAARVAEPYHAQLDGTGMFVIDSVEHASQVALQLEERVMVQLDGVVHLAEQAVDYALPPAKDQDDGVDMSDDAQEPVENGHEVAPLKHAYSLGAKTTHRLMNKVGRIASDTESSLNMKHTLEVVNQYHEHLQVATHKLRESLAQS